MNYIKIANQSEIKLIRIKYIYYRGTIISFQSLLKEKINENLFRKNKKFLGSKSSFFNHIKHFLMIRNIFSAFCIFYK